MAFDYPTKIPISKLFVWLPELKHHVFCTQPQKNSEKTLLFDNFHEIGVVSYSHADSVAVDWTHFLLQKWLFAAKVLLNGHALTLNSVIQS